MQTHPTSFRRLSPSGLFCLSCGSRPARCRCPEKPHYVIRFGNHQTDGRPVIVYYQNSNIIKWIYQNEQPTTANC
jgi:hypothetical protein